MGFCEEAHEQIRNIWCIVEKNLNLVVLNFWLNPWCPVV